MSLPDFLCIGAQKSGTSWLDANLRFHPELWLPPAKELHYFDGGGTTCARKLAKESPTERLKLHSPRWPFVAAWYGSRVGQTTEMTKRVVFCLCCWQLALFGQDTGFDVIGAGTPDKQSVLKGVKRDFFSPLSQEQWNFAADHA